MFAYRKTLFHNQGLCLKTLSRAKPVRGGQKPLLTKLQPRRPCLTWKTMSASCLGAFARSLPSPAVQFRLIFKGLTSFLCTQVSAQVALLCLHCPVGLPSHLFPNNGPTWFPSWHLP